MLSNGSQLLAVCCRRLSWSTRHLLPKTGGVSRPVIEQSLTAADCLLQEAVLCSWAFAAKDSGHAQTQVEHWLTTPDCLLQEQGSWQK